MQDNRCVLIKRLKRVHNNSIVKFRVLAYADGRIKVNAVQQNDTSRRFKKTFSKGEVRERLSHLSYTWTDFDTSDDNTVKVVCTRRGEDFLKLLDVHEEKGLCFKSENESEELDEKEEDPMEHERFSPPSPPRMRKSISMVEDQLEDEFSDLTTPPMMRRTQSAPCLSAKQVVKDAYEILDSQKPIRTILRMEQFKDMGEVRKGRRASRGAKGMTPLKKTMLKRTRSRLLTPVLSTEDELLSPVSLNSTMSMESPKPSFCRKMSFGDDEEEDQEKCESPDAKHIDSDPCQYPRPIRRSQSYASRLRSQVKLSKEYNLPQQDSTNKVKRNFVSPSDSAIAKLLSAARYNKSEKARDALKELKSLGLELSSSCDTNGNTALIVASQSGHLELAQLLVEAGHGLDDTNHRGNTALHYCFAYGHADIAHMLLQEGASDNIVNEVGSDCYDGAL